MRARSNLQLSMIVIVLMALAIVTAHAADDKATVTIKKQSQNNGEIKFGFTPAEGEQKEINVNIVAKMSANKVAEAVHKELAFSLGDAYKVKLNGNKIDLKSKDKSSFKLVLNGQSVEGVSISIK